MDFETYLRFAVALIFVVALIVLLGWMLKRYGIGGNGRPKAGGGRRLGVIEAAQIDARRRLVLVRRDNVEHLVLLGPSGETVVETGIEAPEGAAGPPVTEPDGNRGSFADTMRGLATGGRKRDRSDAT